MRFVKDRVENKLGKILFPLKPSICVYINDRILLNFLIRPFLRELGHEETVDCGGGQGQRHQGLSFGQKNFFENEMSNISWEAQNCFYF